MPLDTRRAAWKCLKSKSRLVNCSGSHNPMRVFAPHAVDPDRSARRDQKARAPLPGPASHVLAFHGGSALQRESKCDCGGGCPGCQSTLPVQMKLSVSQPRDIHEQEADRVADQIMGMAEPT